MADRTISTRFWNDPFVEQLTAHEMLIFIYLFSSEDSRVCGLFQCSPFRIKKATGIPTEETSVAFDKFEQAQKIVYDSGLVFVRKASKNQKVEKLGYFHEHVIKTDAEFYSPGNRAYDAFAIRFDSLLKSIPKSKLKPIAAKKKRNKVAFKNSPEPLAQPFS